MDGKIHLKLLNFNNKRLKNYEKSGLLKEKWIYYWKIVLEEIKFLWKPYEKSSGGDWKKKKEFVEIKNMKSLSD